MNIDDLDIRIRFQQFTQLGNIHIHAAALNRCLPKSASKHVALQDIVGMSTKQGEQFRFLGRQFGLLTGNGKQLLLGIENHAAKFVHLLFFGFLPRTRRMMARYETPIFHAERFGNVIVSTYFKAFITSSFIFFAVKR